MVMTKWQKFNLFRILITMALYLLYTAYVVAAKKGVYVLNVMMFAAAIFNAVFSIVLLFIDNKELKSGIKKTTKNFYKRVKFVLVVLKTFVMLGSFVNLADEKSAFTIAWSFGILSLYVVGFVFDAIKVKVKDGVEKIADDLKISKDWRKVEADGVKMKINIKGKGEHKRNSFNRNKLYKEDTVIKDGYYFHVYDKEHIYYLGTDGTEKSLRKRWFGRKNKVTDNYENVVQSMESDSFDKEPDTPAETINVD